MKKKILPTIFVNNFSFFVEFIKWWFFRVSKLLIIMWHNVSATVASQLLIYFNIDSNMWELADNDLFPYVFLETLNTYLGSNIQSIEYRYPWKRSIPAWI